MNKINTFWAVCLSSLLLLLSFVTVHAQDDVAKLVSAMLSDTPIEENLHELCDEIGGRVTGTAANLEAVEWGLAKFKEAGVTARKEAFQMARLWVEKDARADISGVATFSPRVVSRAFSAGTPKEGVKAPLILAGYGTAADFERLGERAKGKFVLIQTELLTELGGLFKEYEDVSKIEVLAQQAGVKGVVYMSSRPKKLLFRYLAAKGPQNRMTLVVMARDDATRCVRLLENGGNLDLHLRLDLQEGDEYESYNVIGEIKGSTYPDEVVLFGAHLDSWGLGTGANDNGCNISMMIDIARQIKRLGIQPKRTIRFALWNGEEQGMWGSRAYTQQHDEELAKHVVAGSIDIGSGRITGFFTGARPEVKAATDKHLEAVSGLGPFANADVPVVGTDNYDFMIQGIGNLIGIHEGANYCEDYHSESDTYDKVDLQSLKLNSAIVAAVALGFANMDPEDITWKRLTRTEIEQTLFETTDLVNQMKAFGHWQGWEEGWRGRK